MRRFVVISVYGTDGQLLHWQHQPTRGRDADGYQAYLPVRLLKKALRRGFGSDVVIKRANTAAW